MKNVVRWFAGLLLAAFLVVPIACGGRIKTPPMPQAPNPQPGPGASAQEVERYRLIEEKRALEAQYGDNLDRIRQINARLIELNIELQQRGVRP